MCSACYQFLRYWRKNDILICLELTRRKQLFISSSHLFRPSGGLPHKKHSNAHHIFQGLKSSFVKSVRPFKKAHGRSFCATFQGIEPKKKMTGWEMSMCCLKIRTVHLPLSLLRRHSFVSSRNFPPHERLLKPVCEEGRLHDEPKECLCWRLFTSSW